MHEKHQTSIKSNWMNEYQSTIMSLDCFLRIYSILNNFVEFLEFRGFNYCLVHYKKLPLKGALEISSKMMVSNIHENLFKQVMEWPGLFANAFYNTHCSKLTDISKDIANEIEATIKHLTKSTIKNYSTQMGSILFALANLSCIPASKRLQILSVLLKETAERMTCCEEIAKELPAHIQTKTLLNLASNFIREWGEKLCKTRSHFKMCKFCDSIINDETRQYVKNLCCGEAEHFNRLLKEWLSLYVSHNTSKLKSADSTKVEYKMDYSHENTLQKNDFTRIDNINNAGLQLIIPTIENGIATLENHYKIHIGSQSKIYPNTSTKLHDKRQDIVLNTSGEVDPRKADHLIQSAIEMGHGTGIANDRSEANGNPSPQREKTRVLAGEARSEDHTKNTDIETGRIRGRRENNPYQRRLGEVEDKDRQDRRFTQRDMQEEANRSWIAAGETRKDGDTKNGNTIEESSGNPDKNPYHRREERETRLLDNGMKKIGRLDRVEEKSISIETSRATKRPEVKQDGNDRNRHENEENPTTHRDRKAEGKERTMLLNKNKEPGSKKATVSLDDAKESPFAVSEEGKLLTNDEQRKAASTEKRYDLEEARKWRVYPSNPIEYQLSNAHFVELGWTLLPITKTMRKIVQYEARPAKPNLDWFKKYKHKDMEYYKDGLTPFLKFHPDGSGELFYPNGVLAIRVYKPKNRKYDMYTVFTPGGKDALGIERGSQLLAIFDTMGYGVIFDVDGAARLSYNQIGGIFTDNLAGLPLIWIWNAKPRESILETVYTERPTDWLQMEFFSATNKSAKSSGNVKTLVSPSSSRNKEKKVVEIQKPVVEKQQEEVGNKSTDNQDFSKEDICPHMKVICMKLNEFLSLRIIDRKNISLRFSAGNKNIRIELGTVMNFNKEKASRMIEASDWKSDMLRCRFEENLSKTLESDSSLYDLAKEYRKVKRLAKQRKVMIAKYKPFSMINRAFTRSCKVRN
ncbi:uncharacterized protein [Polyergus mexicanus]|uniref:uncharacterized protein n=1 Tax=Polyergus mexicanus TaxID=615972 RepID=UPI0038B635EC